MNRLKLRNQEETDNLYLFDTIISQDLIVDSPQLLQTAKNQQPLILEDIIVSSDQNIIQQASKISLQENSLKIELQDETIIYLGLEFSYLTLITENLGTVGFKLTRRNQSFDFKLKNLNQKKSLKGIISMLKQYTVGNFEQLLKFNFLEKIGQGSQAVVFKAQKKNKYSNANTSNEFYGIKVIEKGNLELNFQRACLVNEIRNQRALCNSQFIIRLQQVVEDKEKIYLIQEYANNGTLADLISSPSHLTFQQEIFLAAQILIALDQMSSLGIVHRDIKPQNILLQSTDDYGIQIKITDFGYSMNIYDQSEVMCDDEQLICGTPGYFAPESIRNIEYTLKSDIFGTGVILYNIFAKRNLFKGLTAQDVLQKNKKCDYSDINIAIRYVPFEARNLVKHLLRETPELRITAKQALSYDLFRQFLKHKLIGQYFNNISNYITIDKSMHFFPQSHIYQFKNSNSIRSFTIRQYVVNVSIKNQNIMQEGDHLESFRDLQKFQSCMTEIPQEDCDLQNMQQYETCHRIDMCYLNVVATKRIFYE